MALDTVIGEISLLPKALVDINEQVVQGKVGGEGSSNPGKPHKIAKAIYPPFRKAGKFLSPWMPSVSFGMSVTRISTAEQAEGVFSSEAQANEAMTAMLHRVWKTRLRECASCKCWELSAILSSVAPS